MWSAAVHAFIVQRAAGAAFDDGDQFLRRCTIGENPRAAVAVKDGGQPTHALGGVDTERAVEGDMDGGPGVALAGAARRGSRRGGGVGFRLVGGAAEGGVSAAGFSSWVALGDSSTGSAAFSVLSADAVVCVARLSLQTARLA